MGNNKGERGSVLTEFSTMLPLLFLLVIASIESGSVLSYHSTLRDTVHSGAKFAAGIPSLQVGSDYWGADCGAVVGLGSSAHAKVHQRIVDVLHTDGYTLDPAKTCIKTTVTSSGSYTDVAVQMDVDYDGQLFKFGVPHFSIRQTTPYLMN